MSAPTRPKLSAKKLWIVLAIFCLGIPASNAASEIDSLLKLIRERSAALTNAQLLYEADQNSRKNMNLAVAYALFALEKANSIGTLNDIFNAQRELGFIYEDNSQFTVSLKYYHQAATTAEALNKVKNLLDIYTDLAIVNRKAGNYKKCRDFHTKAKDLAEQSKDLIMLENSYHGLGYLYESIGDFNKSIEYYLGSLGIAEKRKSIDGQVMTLQNISQVYLKTKNQKEALNNIERAIKLAKGTKKDDLLASVMLDYGKVLNDLGQPGNALVRLKEAQNLYLQLNDKSGQAQCQLALGLAYVNLQMDTLTIKHLKNSEALTEHLDPESKAMLYYVMGDWHEKHRMEDRAEQYFNVALELAKRYNYKNIEYKIYKAIAEISEKEGDYRKALENLEISMRLHDQLLTEERNSNLAEMQFKYDMEKSEKEIQQLKYQKNQLWFLYFLLVLIGLSIFLVNSNRLRNQKNKMLQEKNLEIEAQNRQLQESNELLRKFAYVAAHDLKEPLRNIGNFSGLLERKYRAELTEEGAAYLEHIRHSTKRMNNLLVDLLEYSTISSEQAIYEKVDMVKILDEVKNNLRNRIDQTDAIVRISNDWPQVQMKHLHAVQLMQNLIGNSLKFVQGQPIIQVEHFVKNDMITMVVRDNGIGMKKEYAERIFELFQRVHKQHGYEGTGIGLAICKNIVEKYQGEIWFESEEGVGTTFFIRVPLTSHPLLPLGHEHEHSAAALN